MFEQDTNERQMFENRDMKMITMEVGVGGLPAHTPSAMIVRLYIHPI